MCYMNVYPVDEVPPLTSSGVLFRPGQYLMPLVMMWLCVCVEVQVTLVT